MEKNPSNASILPRVIEPAITSLDTPDLAKLLRALHGHEYDHVHDHFQTVKKSTAGDTSSSLFLLNYGQNCGQTPVFLLRKMKKTSDFTKVIVK